DLHGTGGNKNNELPLLRKLAQKGFIAVAIDARFHGERAAGAPKDPGLNAYQTAIFHAWNVNEPNLKSNIGQSERVTTGPAPDSHPHPFFYDRVWDALRLIDYLETRQDVDPERIGMIGTSKGGIETYFTAAVDTRVAVVVPMIAVQSFKWA